MWPIGGRQERHFDFADFAHNSLPHFYKYLCLKVSILRNKEKWQFENQNKMAIERNKRSFIVFASIWQLLNIWPELENKCQHCNEVLDKTEDFLY